MRQAVQLMRQALPWGFINFNNLWYNQLIVCSYNGTMSSINSTLEATQLNSDESMDLFLELSESSEESMFYKTAALPCKTAYESSMDICGIDYDEVTDIPALNISMDNIEDFQGQPVASSTFNSSEMNAALNNVPRIALRSLRINHSDSSGNSSNEMLYFTCDNAPNNLENFNELPSELELRLDEIPERYPEPHMNHEAPAPTPISKPTVTNFEFKHLTTDDDCIYFVWAKEQSQRDKDSLIASNGYVYTVKSDKRRDMKLYPVYRCCAQGQGCKAEFIPAIPGGRKFTL